MSESKESYWTLDDEAIREVDNTRTKFDTSVGSVIVCRAG